MQIVATNQSIIKLLNISNIIIIINFGSRSVRFARK